MRYIKENSEGTTYKSNMGLIDIDSSKSKKCIDILDEKIPTYETKEFAVIFFDLETVGTDERCDILQISMKCDRFCFHCFIQPKTFILQQQK